MFRLPDLPNAGYATTIGESPWVLTPSELLHATATGIADAVTELGSVDAVKLAAWRDQQRTRLVIGHRDVFAVKA